MNSNSNLLKALKKAFEEHKEPLHEAQWERLNAALGGKKSKRKFLPWFFIIIAIAGLSAGLGYWLGNTTSNSNKITINNSSDQTNEDKSQSSGINKEPANQNNNSQSEQPKENNTKTEDNKEDNSDKNVNLSENKMQDPDKNNIKGQYEKYANTGSQNNSADKKNANGADKTNKSLNNDQSFSDKSAGGKTGLSKSKENSKAKTGDDKYITATAAQDNSDGNKKDQDKTVDKTADNSSNKTADSPSDKIADKPVDKATDKSSDKTADKPTDKTTDKQIAKTADNTVDKKDSSITTQKKKDTTIDKTKEIVISSDGYKRFAIGFTSGLSRSVYKNIVFTDPEKMHMDTRDLYNQSVKKTSSSFANLFFDIKVFKNISLTFNTGIQYRQIQSQEDITYKYNNITWRNPGGGIDFYIPIPDSSAVVFHNKSTNITRFVSIPLALSYTLPIGNKNEIQLSGGVIFNKIVSAKGQTLSVNEGDVVNYSEKMRRKISLGYLAGFNYYRQIYQPWWIGVGLQLQQTKTQFNTSYGYIKSNINITNYTLNIKYKF